MPTYADLKAVIVANVEAKYASDPTRYARLRAALGDAGAGPYNTVVVGEDPDGGDLVALAGSAWGPPEDATAPEAGPDPDQLDETVIAELVQGVADYLETEWKPILNELIDDYNSRHATAIDNLP